MSTARTERAARARAALDGVAIGDALGMPTQSLERADIVARYGPLLDDFRAPSVDHPYASGLPAGSVTDDTEQTVLMARLLLRGHGTVNVRDLADALTTWERSVRERGLRDLLGPSTTRALQRLRDGAPLEEVGRGGNTNGAAMRVTPFALAYGPARCRDMVRRIVEASRLTHNDPTALAATVALAGAVSRAVEGGGLDGALDGARTAVAYLAVDEASTRPFREAFARACAVGVDADDVALIESIRTSCGTSVLAIESVPAAFAVTVASHGDPWRGVRVAASLGDDTDTIASMAGALLGALNGASAWPATALEIIERVNELNLHALADELIALRQ